MDRGEGKRNLMEKAESSSIPGRVGGLYFSRSGAKFIYFPGSYNEILLTTLL